MTPKETLSAEGVLDGFQDQPVPLKPRQQYELIEVRRGVMVPTLMYQTLFLNAVKSGTVHEPVFQDDIDTVLNHDDVGDKKLTARRERAFRVTKDLVEERTEDVRLGRRQYETADGVKIGYFMDVVKLAEEDHGRDGILPSPDQVFKPGSVAWKFYRQQLIALALDRTPNVTEDIFMIYGSLSPRNRRRYELLVGGVNKRLGEFGVRLIPEMPEKPKPKAVKEIESELTDKDIHVITEGVGPAHKFNNMDLRALAKLISLDAGSRIYPDDLARFMSQKTSGLAKYMTMLQSLIPLYNKTVLEGTDIRVQAVSGNFKDPQAYVVRYSSTMNIEERRKIIETKLLSQLKAQQNTDSYQVRGHAKELNQDQIDVEVLKNDKTAAVVVLKNSDEMDGVEAGERVKTEPVSAQAQWKLLQILFCAGPIPKYRINTELSASDGLGIVKGDRKNDLEMAAIANVLSDSLRSVGLSVEEHEIDFVAHYVLKKYHPNTYKRVEGKRALTVGEEEALVGARQRRRRAKHD